MRQPSLARQEPRLTGVIDTLSDGFGVVNRHPWIILIPIVLDLFLWWGPQLSAARLVSQALGLLARGRTGLTLDQAQQRDLVEAAEAFNLLAGLAPSIVGVPSLVAALGIRDPLRSTPVESWGAALAIFSLALLGGMLLGSLYYALLAQLVRRDGVRAASLPGEMLGAWWRVLSYLILLAIIGLLIGLPSGVLLLGATLLSPLLGSLLISALTMGLVWLGVFLFFVPEAIFISQVGPVQAIRNSAAVVRLHFWSCIGLIVLVSIVLLGMGRVWELASANLVPPVGTGLGIVGNAYIGSALVIAGMAFYRERIERLVPARPESPGL